MIPILSILFLPSAFFLPLRLRVFAMGLSAFWFDLEVFPGLTAPVRLPHLVWLIGLSRFILDSARREGGMLRFPLALAGPLVGIAISWAGLMITPTVIVILSKSDVTFVNLISYGLNKVSFTTFTQAAFVAGGILIAWACWLHVSNRNDLQLALLHGMKWSARIVLLTGILSMASIFFGFHDMYSSFYRILANEHGSPLAVSTGLPTVFPIMWSFAGEPSYLAIILAGWAIVAARQTKHLTSLFEGAVFLGAAMLTNSTTGFLLAVVGGVFIIWERARQSSNMFLVYFSSMLVSLTALLIFQQFIFNAVFEIQGGTGSSEVRSFIFYHNLGVFFQSPLLGVGWGQERTLLFAVGLLANLGIVGALFFVAPFIKGILSHTEPNGLKPILGMIIIASFFSLSEAFAVLPVTWISLGGALGWKKFRPFEDLVSGPQPNLNSAKGLL